MRRWIAQWPAMVWPLMSLASLYILVGTSGRWRPGAFAIGAVLALATFGIALWAAMRPLPGRPGDRKLFWPMFALGAWYLALAAAAGLAGPWYAVAGLAAGIIPLSALALMLAVARRKTAVTEDGRLVDISADREDDPFPGIGFDSHDTQLGDTPERADHPQRQEQERRRFERRSGRERSHPRH